MKVIVRNVRLGFNDLFEPKSVMDGDPKYSCTLICSDETEITVNGKKVAHGSMMQVIDKVLKDKLGKVPAKFKNWVYCKADGSLGAREEYTNDDGEYHAGFDADTFYMSCAKRADKAPNGIKVMDQNKEPITAASGRLFAGCYVNVILDVYAMEGKAGVTVQASLEGVQLLRRGESLGITPIDADAEFDIEETTEDENPF